MHLHSADSLFSAKQGLGYTQGPGQDKTLSPISKANMKESNQEETLPKWFSWSTLTLSSHKMGEEEEPRHSCKCRRKHLTTSLRDMLRQIIAGKLAGLNQFCSHQTVILSMNC